MTTHSFTFGPNNQNPTITHIRTKDGKNFTQEYELEYMQDSVGHGNKQRKVLVPKHEKHIPEEVSAYFRDQENV